MAAPSNHWKLGLFVVVSVVLAAIALIVLGAQTLQRDMITYVTFFDESVQGLDVGSPVKFRGVVIGNVSKIAIAPDRRHVAVYSDLAIEDITSMGIAVRKGKKVEIDVPADLRMQLASQGLTGVKFLQLDFFALESNPPPKLDFPTPANYIPPAVSVMKNIEDSVVNAVNRIPEAADQALAIMKHINGMLAEIEEKKMPDKAEDTLERVNSVLASLERAIQGADTAGLSKQTQQTLAEIETSAKSINALVARATAEDGLYTSAERTTFAVNEAARSASGASADLQATLRAVEDAASSIQRLADALEKDSDMLVKGRARRASR